MMLHDGNVDEFKALISAMDTRADELGRDYLMASQLLMSNNYLTTS